MQIHSIDGIEAKARAAAQAQPAHPTAESYCPYAPDSAAGQIFIKAFNAARQFGAACEESENAINTKAAAGIKHHLRQLADIERAMA